MGVLPWTLYIAPRGEIVSKMPGRTPKRSPLQLPGQQLHLTLSSVIILPLILDKPYIALGLEGSANKLGAGVIKHSPDGSTTVLSNVRHTYVTPPGEGFLPRDTALHHRQWAMTVIKDSLKHANISLHDVDCICYTKGVDECTATVVEWLIYVLRSWYGSTIDLSGIGCTDAVSVVQQAPC